MNELILIKRLIQPNIKYGDIFTKSSYEKDIVNQYREYCKLIHPDACSDKNATDAFMVLRQLYQNALTAIKANTWEASNYIEYKTTKNKTLQIRYLYHYEFEIGEYYVCKNVLIYLFNKDKDKYYNNFIKQVKNLKYSDKNMEKTFSQLFPKILSDHITIDNRHLVVLQKTEDVYPLKCLIENGFNNNIPNTHLAWITSRLLNISCYLYHNNLVSNGIDINNLFVSPKFHSILLLGGWWYTTKVSENMIGTTKNIYNIMSPKTKGNKQSEYTTDIESIKAIGRKWVDTSAPDVIKNFYNEGSCGDALIEMEKWDKALLTGYGKRTFIKIDDNIINNIYNEKGK